MAKRNLAELTLEGKELDEMYRKYLASYGNKARLLKKDYDLGMWDIKYSKAEFKAMYEATARTIMSEKGWYKINEKFVIRNMVERQATELTEAQALAFQKGMRDKGKYMTLKEVYKTAPELIKQMYDQLAEDGVDVEQRKAIISSAFFGSPT